MKKKLLKVASIAMVASMVSVSLPNIAYATDNESILNYNRSQISKVGVNSSGENCKENFNITNDYSKLTYVKNDAFNMTQPDRVNGPNDFPDGIFIPESISKYVNADKMKNTATSFCLVRIFSLGVTGTEIENNRAFIESTLKTDSDDGYAKDAKPVYDKLTYPLGDMYVEGDSASVFKSSSEYLSQKGINIKANMKPYIDSCRVNYTGNSQTGTSDLINELIYEVKLPEGVSVKAISGDLKNNIKVSGKFYKVVDASLDGNVIKICFANVAKDVVTMRLQSIKDGDMDIDVNICGVYYTDNAKLADNYTVEGTLSGFTATGKNSTWDWNKENPIVTDPGVAFDYSIYSIKQDPKGKDNTSDLGGLMSVTLALKSNTVTFKVDGKKDQNVLVETGKSIDGDIDKTQSMPKNPTKEGYTFKEWNTQKDGKGTKFDGKTTVNNDITVYAIFVKKPNNPRPNPNKPVPGRIDGGDRIETGIEISKKHYDKAKTVIVVRHDLFPDSMTASVLAKLKDAPILLNPTNKLDPRVGAEIKRLGASEVIIVGGQNSISEKVREELRIYDADKDVERIAGHDRYGTSEMVARRVVGITGKKNKAVVASGEVFPDALAVGTYASREGYPILLVRKDLVPTQITKAIKDLEIKNTYIAGGYNTISKSTELKLPGVLERMAGKTRYETAIAIARSKFADSKEAYIASGEEFADALAISPMSGKYNRPTLLVKSKAGQNKIVSDYVYFKNINRITAIGGYRYIPNDVLKELVN